MKPYLVFWQGQGQTGRVVQNGSCTLFHEGPIETEEALVSLREKVIASFPGTLWGLAVYITGITPL